MIFDANIALGRFAGTRGRYFADAEELLTAMDKHGIARALVYGVLAKETDCVRGNALLMRNIAGEKRLVPCWVTVPDERNAESFVSAMKESGVGAVRLFPHSGHFSIRPWACVAALAKLMERERMLLLIDFESGAWSDTSVDWEGVYQLCQAFPKLNVLVCGVMVAGPANYRGLLGKCSNLHIEISQLASPGEIVRLIETGFGDRIVFGTALPAKHPGNILTMLQKEIITENDHHQIVSGNLSRLLRLTDAPISVPQPDIPQAECVIDSHTHLGGWNHSASGSGESKGILKDMDRCGVTSAILTSIWSCYGEVSLGNKSVADACADHPGRFYGYLTVDPKYPKEVQNEIDKYDDDANFVGIKLHCGLHEYTLTGSEAHPILEYADSKGIPVLVHSGFNPDDWEDVCTRYPNAKFIVAHLGGCGPDMPFARKLAKLSGELDNLYFDIAASKAFYGFLEELVALAGSDKILFGSDHPIFDFGYELGQVFRSELSLTDQTKILSTNAQSIFKLS